MKLSNQLTLAIGGVVLVTAVALGLFTYRSVEAAILPGQLERAEMRDQLLANGIETFVGAIRADVLGFRSGAVQGVVRASTNGGVDARDGTTLNQWRARLAGRIVGEIANKPAYAEVRLIGIADNGREIVGVERSSPNGAIRIVENDELQQEGGSVYFQEAIHLDPGEVYVSDIDLKREHGAVAIPHEPILRIATAVAAPDGSPFGILVVTANLSEPFEAVRGAGADGRHYYLVDDRGNFLVHPNATREFGFEFGKTFHWQDEFPGFVGMLGSATRGAGVIGGDAIVISDDAGVISDDSTERIGIAMSSVQLGEGPRVAVLSTVPYAALVAPAGAAKLSILAIGIVAGLGALLLAIAAARSITGPLEQMTVAVERFSHGQPVELPLRAAGEIGTFARAFSRLLGEVRAKTAALEEEVTAHHRTEAELELHADRERLYSAAVQSSMDAIITETLEGVVTGWNPAAEKLFGYGADEMIGMSIDTIVPDERRAELKTILGRIGRGEIVNHHQTVRVTKAGREIDVSLSISPLKSPAGVIIGACKIGRDVTEQKLAEQKFQWAVEASPSGILMTDMAGRMVLVNSEIEKLFGYRRDELIGQSVDILIPENMRARHVVQRGEYAIKPAPRRLGARRELVGRRKDGTVFPVDVGLNPIKTREGVLILSAINDITERKRLDRLKEEFVATVSHELRTPLTSIAGSLGLLLGAAAGEVPESARRLLSIAHSNSQRLGKLVNDILDIEKLESGHVSFKFKVAALRPLIEQAVDANLGYADTYLVRLRHDLAAVDDVWVDPDRLSQVLTNLISNAIKFSPPDGEVVVTTERRDFGVRISVRDQGAGVPPEFKSRVFQKFAQADGTNTKKTGGTGLGLSIVKEIVTRLGGEVGFNDAPDGGTIFYVDLPGFDQSAGAQPLSHAAAAIKQIA